MPKQVIKVKFVYSLNNKIILVMQNAQTEFPHVLSHRYLPLGISSVSIASKNDIWFKNKGGGESGPPGLLP